MRQRTANQLAKQRRRTVVDSEFAIVTVIRLKRTVRLTVVTKQESYAGHPNASTFGVVDLDDDALDRLVQRLTAIRGGKKTVWKPKR